MKTAILIPHIHLHVSRGQSFSCEKNKNTLGGEKRKKNISEVYFSENPQACVTLFWEQNQFVNRCPLIANNSFPRTAVGVRGCDRACFTSSNGRYLIFKKGNKQTTKYTLYSILRTHVLSMLPSTVYWFLFTLWLDLINKNPDVQGVEEESHHPKIIIRTHTVCQDSHSTEKQDASAYLRDFVVLTGC